MRDLRGLYYGREIFLLVSVIILSEGHVLRSTLKRGNVGEMSMQNIHIIS